MQVFWLPGDCVGVNDEDSGRLQTVRRMAGMKGLGTGVDMECCRAQSVVSWNRRGKGGEVARAVRCRMRGRPLRGCKPRFVAVWPMSICIARRSSAAAISSVGEVSRDDCAILGVAESTRRSRVRARCCRRRSALMIQGAPTPPFRPANPGIRHPPDFGPIRKAPSRGSNCFGIGVCGQFLHNLAVTVEGCAFLPE
jgi:hypothetical protein